jgi:rfaE bifunctional protein nucleotidyltransferase chain/domain
MTTRRPAPTCAQEKILSLVAVRDRVVRARNRGERIVFTNGCFDLLHIGHVRSLEEARGLGDRLIVAVNLDASVRRQKGQDRTIQKARTRMEIVAALACVDWVVGFGADTPIRPIRAIQPDVLAKGGDWAEDEIIGGSDVLESGGQIVRLAIVRGHRTSETITRIQRRPVRQKR